MGTCRSGAGWLCRCVWGVLFLVLWASDAAADRIHLKNGNVMEGTILAEDETSVTIRLGTGTAKMEIPRDMIERIERMESPAAEYARRRDALAPDDLPGRVELAAWCRSQGMQAEARRELLEVLKQDDDHAEARKALGFVRVGNEWVPEAVARARRWQARGEDWTRLPANTAVVAELRRELRDLLAVEAEDRATAVIAQIAARKDVPVSAVEVLVSQAPTGVVHRGGDERHPFPIRGAEVTSVYYLHFPERPSDTEKVPLLVWMHGTGGGGQMDRAMLTPPSEEYGVMVLCPQATVHRWDGWGSTPEERSTTMSAIDDAIKRYNIDPDRVFLGGVSMGGNGSWEIGMLFADRLAGIAPFIGGPRLVNFGYLENLRGVGIYGVIGAKDDPAQVWNNRKAVRLLEPDGADVTLHEYPEHGHSFPPREVEEVFRWMRDRRRDVYPTSLVVTTAFPDYGRSYWARIDELAANPWDPYENREVNLKKGDGEDEAREAYIRMARSKVPRLEGRIVTENRIDVTTRGVRKFTLFLSDRMVDLERPVEIRVNGRRQTTQRVARDVSYMLRHVRATRDVGRRFVGEVTLNVR